MSGLLKNTANQSFCFALIGSATAAAVTGATVSVFVTKDPGISVTQTAGAGTVTEQGNGQYSYRPTQAETNAISVAFLFTASGAVPDNLQFFTN